MDFPEACVASLGFAAHSQAVRSAPRGTPRGFSPRHQSPRLIAQPRPELFPVISAPAAPTDLQNLRADISARTSPARSPAASARRVAARSATADTIPASHDITKTPARPWREPVPFAVPSPPTIRPTTPSSPHSFPTPARHPTPLRARRSAAKSRAATPSRSASPFHGYPRRSGRLSRASCVLAHDPFR